MSWILHVILSFSNAYCIQHSPTATVQNTHLRFSLGNGPEHNSDDDEILGATQQQQHEL